MNKEKGSKSSQSLTLIQQQQHQYNNQQQQNNSKETLQKIVKIKQPKGFPHQIQNLIIHSPYKLYQSQSNYIQNIIKGLNKQQNCLIQSPTGSGKTLSLFLSTLSWVANYNQKIGHNSNYSFTNHKKNIPIKIIYTSRTHTQLKQAIKELKKVSINFKNLKMAVLSSRQHTCINSDLKLMNQKNRDLQCRLRVAKKNKMYCKYFQYEDYYFNSSATTNNSNTQSSSYQFGKIADLQQINHIGQTQSFCPYFYQRAAVKKANIIFAPYNYLFDTSEYNQQQNPLISLIQNSIIIFDQGHNIPSVCQNSEEFSINLGILSNAMHQFQEFREDILQNLNTNLNPAQKMEKIESKDNIKPGKKSLQNNNKNQLKIDNKRKSKSREIIDQQSLTKIAPGDLQKHIAYIQDIHTNLQLIKLQSQGNNHNTSMQYSEKGVTWNIKQLIQFLFNATQFNVHGRLTGKKMKQLCQKIFLLKNAIQFRPYWAIEIWSIFCLKLSNLMDFLDKQQKQTSSQEQKINSFEASKCIIYFQGASQVKMSIINLNPAISFKQLTKKRPFNIILTSGTLTPLKTWQVQLKTSFPNPISCHHQINPNQIKACILKTTPSNIKLNFSYNNRNNKSLYQDIGYILLDIFRNTPNGVIVLFPSYQILETTRQVLSSSNLMAKLYQLKGIFFEQKNSKNFKNTLNAYINQCNKKNQYGNTGAAMLALVRGKIAQGLDFADQKCRAIVLIGIPYPNIKDLKIQAKMKYLDTLFCEKKQKLSQGSKNITGSEWYITQTIRSINQSIGRIIRHPKDYGSVYLLDQRYTKSDIKNQLPSYIKDSISIIQTYQIFKSFLSSTRKSLDNFRNQIKREELIQYQMNNQNQIMKEIINSQKDKNIPIFNFVSHRGTKLGSIGQQIIQKQQKKGTISKPLTQQQKNNQQKKFVSSGVKSLQQMIRQAKQKQQLKLKEQNQNIQKKNQQKQQIDEIKSIMQKIKVQKNKQKTILLEKSKQKTKSKQIQRQKQKQGFKKKPQRFQLFIKTAEQRKYWQECPVCKMKKKLVGNTQCIHQLCKQCWNLWLGKDLRCPICRVRVRPKYLKVQEKQQ